MTGIAETYKHSQGYSNPNGSNKLALKDRAIHDWYRFVLSFPPHLVREYLHKFKLSNNDLILDPFCGTGTTLVEAKKLGINNIGIEANHIAYFASKVKVNWNIDPADLLNHAKKIADNTLLELKKQGIEDDILFSDDDSKDDNILNNGKLLNLSLEKEKLLLKNSISPIPLHKSIILLKHIEAKKNKSLNELEKLAFAKTLVNTASNLHFGPEVGVRRKKYDALVVPSWLNEIRQIANDLLSIEKNNFAISKVIFADSRNMEGLIEPSSISAVFTSPPYPNEKDYTRTTRLESVLLGFLNNKQELRAMKKGLLRSNTRGVYKTDNDDKFISPFTEIENIANTIEKRRKELAKNSGFEKLYAKVTKLYFGGMYRHFETLRRYLKPGAYLGYVVGDQASYLRVMIRTGQLLAEIARSLGYEVINIDLFRTRFASATREQINEEVVLLRWPG